MRNRDHGSVTSVALLIAGIFALLALAAFAYFYLKSTSDQSTQVLPPGFSQEKADVLGSLQDPSAPGAPSASPPDTDKQRVLDSVTNANAENTSSVDTRQSESQKADILRSLGAH